MYSLSEEINTMKTMERIANKIEDRNMLFDAVILRKIAGEVDHAVENFSPLVKALELILSSINKDSRYPRRLKIIEVVEETLANARREEEVGYGENLL